MRPQPARGTLSDAALPAMLQEPQLPAAWLLIFNWLIRPICFESCLLRRPMAASAIASFLFLGWLPAAILA